MICWVRSAIFIASSDGIAYASSSPLVWSDWAPPSTAASAWSAVRTMLFIGCAFVSVAAAVWQWKRRRMDSACAAPKRAFMSFAQIRRAARNFATSSKKSAWAMK